MRRVRGYSPYGFTLVELLVVVSIIALLISILIPSLQKAREQALKVICQTRLKGLSTGSFAYYTEWRQYPPSISNFADSPTASVRALATRGAMDWLGIGDMNGAFVAGTTNDPQSGTPKGFMAAPRFGKLWPYTNNEELYLCSKDKPGQLEAGTLFGGGGNGKFSYSQFSNMGLRDPDSIPTRFADEASGSSRGPRPAQRRLTKRALSAVPLFVEEHPAGTNDRSNNGNMEGNFNFSTDYVVSRHGPFQRRLGIKPNSAAGGAVQSFDQGDTDIGFADGHVEDLKVNFGFTSSHVRPQFANGQGLKGIPYTAEGLLYHFGIEYDVIKVK